MSDEKIKVNPFAAMAQAMGGMAPPSTAGMEYGKGPGIPLSQVFRDYAVASIRAIEGHSAKALEEKLEALQNAGMDIDYRLLTLAIEMREKMLENIR